jgi:AraC-like DNA-binding protein
MASDMEMAQEPAVKVWELKDIGEAIRGPLSEPLRKTICDGLMIGLLETGTVEASYRRETHILGRGTLILGQPDETVSFMPAGQTSGPVRICLRCPREVVQAASDEIADRTTATPFFPNFITPDPQLVALFLMFQRTLDSSASLLERSSRFQDVLASIINRHASPPQVRRNMQAEPYAVRRVRQYLHDNYTNNVTLDELARLVGLSGFHLNRVFRMEVGIPPHAYQTQVRVTTAKQLLAKGWSVDQAATSVGFFDQSHFTNHLRRLFGYTPGVYQKSILNK